MESVSNNQSEVVIEWLRNELRLSRNRLITTSTAINIDLGVAGDDGVEFMQAFGDQFGIDVSVVSSTRYFGDEAPFTLVSLFRFVFRIIRGKPASELTPLYVSDLIALIEARQSAGSTKREVRSNIPTF